MEDIPVFHFIALFVSHGGGGWCCDRPSTALAQSQANLPSTVRSAEASARSGRSRHGRFVHAIIVLDECSAIMLLFEECATAMHWILVFDRCTAVAMHVICVLQTLVSKDSNGLEMDP